MQAIVCPVCAVRIAERDADGRVIVRRGGQVVAIDPRLIPCRRRDCAGFVELVDGLTTRERIAVVAALGRSGF